MSSSSHLIGSMDVADVVVIALYFAGTIAVGAWSICRSRAKLSGYFLAARSISWWPIGMSLFASNIGSTNFIGIAGSAATTGYAVIMFEWNAVWLLILLGWVFLPVYIGSGIYTMPEYLQWRFGGYRLRIYLTVIALVTYIFSTVSTDLFSGAMFIRQTFGINIYIGVAVILVVSAVFSALGGLHTVVFTDAVAVVVMVLGGVLMSILGLVKIGGFNALEFKFMRALPNTTLQNLNSSCGYPAKNSLHIFRGIDDPNYPWLATLLRTTLGSLWYWCANQVLVQRVLAAKSISHARGGTILAGYLKLLPIFIMVIPGMVARILFPDEVACTDPAICEEVCDTPAGCSNIALSKLVTEILPQGLRGLLVSAVIAAVISSLTSVFNSASALFTLDIWSKLRPSASERELLLVGKVCIILIIGVSVIWIPVMQNAQGGQIFVYATSVTGYLAGPTCAMFVLAVFWTRANEVGSFYGVIIAQAWGLVRFVLDFVYPSPGCGEPDTRPAFVANFHTYYHSVTQVVLAFIVAIVISLITKPPLQEQIDGLTIWTRHKKTLRDLQNEEHLEITSKGLQEPKEDEVAHDNLPESRSDRIRILELSPKIARIINFNAILLMTVTVFVYGWWH